MKYLRIAYISFVLFLCGNALFSQSTSKPVEVYTVILGPQYEKDWLWRFFFGAHWRKCWTTPVEVEMLNLNRFAGGLTPIGKDSTGYSKELRFKGGDGHLYRFRPLQKTPQAVLPQELQKTVVANVFKDQVSSIHPLATIIASPLVRAVGVLSPPIYFVKLPSDSSLKEFKSEFGKLVGILEVDPRGFEEGEWSFAGADEIQTTNVVLDRITKDYRNTIDAKEYLKARLLDIFFGDWDRNQDQWRWAGFRDSNRTVYKPVPRDRDQAFAKFDGVVPWMVSQNIPQLTHFSDTYPPVERSTFSAKMLDRRILSTLSWSEWDSLTAFVKQRLSDSVISSAVQQLPPAMFKICSEELVSNLQKRRDELNMISADLYSLICAEVDLFGTHKADSIIIFSPDENHTGIKISSMDGEIVLLNTVFNNNFTKEIRLRGVDSSDCIDVRLSEQSSPHLCIENLGGIPVTFRNLSKKKILDIYKKNDEQIVRDYGREWLFMPIASSSIDEGWLLGASVAHRRFGIGMNPYKYEFGAGAEAATRHYKYRLTAWVMHYGLVSRTRLFISSKISTLENLWYFGEGNQTLFNESLFESDYYRVDQQLAKIESGFDFLISPFAYFRFALEMKNTKVYQKSGTFIKTTEPYGSGQMRSVSGNFSFIYDTRDNIASAKKGLYIVCAGGFYPKVLDLKGHYSKLRGEMRLYLTADIGKDLTLALRTIGESTTGKVPFADFAYIGGPQSVRSYARNRFAGDASVSVNVELRPTLGTVDAIVPSEYGILALVDYGRVFLKGESSNKWHNAVGGGLWIAPLLRDYTMGFSISRSTEMVSFDILFSFMF